MVHFVENAESLPTLDHNNVAQAMHDWGEMDPEQQWQNLLYGTKTGARTLQQCRMTTGNVRLHARSIIGRSFEERAARKEP